MARVWLSARQKVGGAFGIATGICAVLFVMSATPVNSEPAACPASFASPEDKLACIQDDNCNLSKKWPVEIKRQRWLRDETEGFLQDQLTGLNECVLVGDLLPLFQARIKECRRNEAEVGLITTVTTMINRDRLVSDRRGISKRTSIGLPKLGDC